MDGSYRNGRMTREFTSPQSNRDDKHKRCRVNHKRYRTEPDRPRSPSFVPRESQAAKRRSPSGLPVTSGAISELKRS